MGFEFSLQESGTVELISPSPKEIGYYLARAGCSQDQIFEVGNRAIKAKGPSSRSWDAGNGVTVERRTENRRRIYTISWERKIRQCSYNVGPGAKEA